MDLLSFIACPAGSGAIDHDFLVLNSAAFLVPSRPLMEAYGQVGLYLDRDATGIRLTVEACTWNREKFIDRSGLYKPYKDLNEWLTGTQRKKAQHPGRLRRKL